LGIDLNLIHWLKLRLDQEREHCHRKIEYCLIRTFSELKKKDMASIHISENFNDRLFQKLLQLETPKESFTDRILNQFVYNRTANYAFAGAMACIIAGIIIYNSDINQNTTDSTSVVQTNSFFTDSPSSQNFVTGDEENNLLDELKTNPDEVLFLQKLEKYYKASGKESTANDVRILINQIR